MTTSPSRSAAAAAVAVAALLTAAAVLPAGAQARARPPLVRGTVSMAWAFSGNVGSTDVTTGSVRVEVPVTANLAPWAGWTEYQLGIDCIPEAESCSSDGQSWLVGVVLDASGPRPSVVRPFAAAGIGRWRNDEDSGTATSVALGIALELIPVLAPRAELRIENYPPFGRQALFAAGVQLTIPRPRFRQGS